MSANTARGNTSKRKRIRDLFYTQCEDETTRWKCKCGIEQKQGGTSYTNLISHVIS